MPNGTTRYLGIEGVESARLLLGMEIVAYARDARRRLLAWERHRDAPELLKGDVTVSYDIRRYIVATPDRIHPGLPGEQGEFVAGLWQAELRALHLARVEQRQIAIYLWPECEDARTRERGKQGDGFAIRHYSAGAPLVTAHNERTVRKLAANERLLGRAHTLKFLAHMLDVCAYAARKGEFLDIAERMDALQDDVDRKFGELEPSLADAEEGLQTKHWPREQREAAPAA